MSLRRAVAASPPPAAGVDAMRRRELRAWRRSEVLEMAIAARRTRARLCQAYLADCPSSLDRASLDRASLDRASRLRAARPMPSDPRPCPESAGKCGSVLRCSRGPGTDAPLIPLHRCPPVSVISFDRFEDQP